MRAGRDRRGTEGNEPVERFKSGVVERVGALMKTWGHEANMKKECII